MNAISSTRAIMLITGACLLPGLATAAALLSANGILLNVLAATAAAALTEYGCEWLRGRRPAARALDPSALVTALIVAAALPPGTPLIAAFATVVGIGLGKHAYGGTGQNVFNPAMVGYAAVLISFPSALAEWPQPDLPGAPDGATGATALTAFKYRGAATVEDVWQAGSGFGLLGGLGHEWVALAFLGGGLILFRLRLAAWRPAAGMLAVLCLLALAGYDNGSSTSLGSPAYHLLTGGTLLAACFVVTDPVTHPLSHRGQWLFGALVGTLTFLIRSFGNYPDGIAFAVLLGNALTPYLDRRLGRMNATPADGDGALGD